MAGPYAAHPNPCTQGPTSVLMRSAIVIGGGVAGIAAACALADAGMRVELIEKRPMLGGRASSHIDPRTGELLDECQHGTMRCCTNLADLLERLGVHDQIRYFDALHFLDGDGRRSTIDSCGLPAPLHTAPSFARFKSLSLGDKMAIGRAMVAMLRAAPGPEWDRIDAAAWFARMRQPERAIARFWRPILVSACNEELGRISCTHAFKIFRDGFLANAQGYQFGVPRVPLGALYTEPAVRYIESRGGCVRLRTTVESLDFDAEGRAAGITLHAGAALRADCVVSALQSDLLRAMLPAELRAASPYWVALDVIELSPIMGVHLWFDREIDCPPALAVLDRPIEWIFNKTAVFDLPYSSPATSPATSAPPRSEASQPAITAANAMPAASPESAQSYRSHPSHRSYMPQAHTAPDQLPPPSGGAYLSLVVSASRRWAGVAQETIVEAALADVRACLPEARCARLLRSRVIRWPKATFSPLPGVEALRPDQRSPVAGLYVAGEWTRTGWPSTMESAARSGYLAAERVLEDAGRQVRLVAPDLPPSWLAKLLGRGF